MAFCHMPVWDSNVDSDVALILKEHFTQKLKFGHFRLTSMLMEWRLKFFHPQQISEASGEIVFS